MQPNRNYKKGILEFFLNAGIATTLSYFLQFHIWKKAILFGLIFGFIMAVFYTFILPSFKK